MQESKLHRLVLELCEQELDHRTLAEEALGLLREYLNTRMLLWMTLDPVTLLPTSIHMPRFLFGLEGFVPTKFYFQQFASFELDPDDILSLNWLVKQGQLYGSVYEQTEGDVSQCMRFQKVLSRVGVKDEFRLLLNSSGQIWGMISACRRKTPFSNEEVKTLAMIGPILGSALRRSLLKAAINSSQNSESKPGLILFSDAGEIEHVSPEAQMLLGEDEISRYESYWLKLLQLRDEAANTDSMNIVTPEGAVTLYYSQLGGRETLIVERTRPSVLAGLLIKAYGLSSRETEVVATLCRGWSTRKIAFELDIADYTVQDHLKSIFSKVGVRSRKELVSHLLNNHYLPQNRNNAEPSPKGWFLEE